MGQIVSTLGEDARARIERLQKCGMPTRVTLDSDPQQNGFRKTPGPKSTKQDGKE